MNGLLRLLLAPLLVAGSAVPASTVLVTWDLEFEAPYGDADDPFAPEALRTRLARVAVEVGEVLGSEIRLEGLRIEAVDARREADRMLLELWEELADPRDRGFSASQAALAHARVRASIGSRLGSFDPSTNRIAVHPAAVELAREGDAGDVGPTLDLLLAHELTHAWQHQRLQVFAGEGAWGTTEDEHVRDALVEGTAEAVELVLARRWGTLPTFERLSGALDPGDASEAGTGGLADTRRLARLRWRWPYRAGCAFVEARRQAEGSAFSWERLFRERPQDVWSIEHPTAARQGGHAARPVELDAWAERAAWCLGPARVRLPCDEPWDRDPLRRAEIESRLLGTGLSAATPPWAGCRGGVRLTGRPLQGGLSGTEVELCCWRFDSPEQALAAREALEALFRVQGTRAWLLGSAEREDLHVESLVGADDARVSWALFTSGARGDTLGFAGESAWARCVVGPHLLEAACGAKAVGPAILELLHVAAAPFTQGAEIDRARNGRDLGAANPWAELWDCASPGDGLAPFVRASPEIGAPPRWRDPWISRRIATADGEADVLHYLRQPGVPAAAWLAALEAAAERLERDGRSRSDLLAAALGHEDLDVRRRALHEIGGYRMVPGPLRSDVLARVTEASRHENAAVREGAVRAAAALGAESVLEPGDYDRLLGDPSPAVRAMVALYHVRLGSRVEAALESLRGDAHAMVRAAAAPETPSSSDEAPASLAGFLPPRSDAARQARLRRIREGLAAPGSEPYARALVDLGQLPAEDQSGFLREILQALASATTRDVALSILCANEPAARWVAPRLERFLGHPACRAEILRVYAAHGLALDTGLRARLRGWAQSPSAPLRVASVLVLAAAGEEDERCLHGLEAAMDEVSVEWQAAVIQTAARTWPAHEITKRMRARALVSPFGKLRGAAAKPVDPRVLDEAHLDALFDAVEVAGPDVAAAHWREALGWLDDLGGREHVARGLGVLGRRLDRWAQGGGAPRLTEAAVLSYGLPHLRHGAEAVAALDRLLVVEGPTHLRLWLALLRAKVDAESHPESAQVRAVLDRVYALQDLPADVAPRTLEALSGSLADREALPPELLRGALDVLAGLAPDDAPGADGLFEDHPERVSHVLDLVLPLLEGDRPAGAEIALDVLEAAADQAADLAPALRALLPRATPEIRERLAAWLDVGSEP